MDFTDGIQKFHTAPTPRIGGLPIVLGAALTWPGLPANVQALLGPLLVAGLPAFLFGIAEDMTKRVGVRERLLATMASGVVAWWITGHSITNVDLWGLDWLLKWTLISVLFTAFAIGGVANALNIIDGFNGLASTTATLAFIGYGMIAMSVGDSTLASLCIVLAACVLGFFCVNWPFGKIFLGDGGSYFVGFSLAWVAVLLMERNPSVSAFAALLVCLHPVTEVLFSIYRRRVRKEHPGMPDRLHFHSLLKRRYIARWLKNWSPGMRNSITGLLVGWMTLTAVVVVQWTYDSTWQSAMGFFVLAMGYVTLYARMVRHHWCSPVAFILAAPTAPRRPGVDIA